MAACKTAERKESAKCQQALRQRLTGMEQRDMVEGGIWLGK